MNDKIIVTNLGALKKKYGANGLAKIRATVKALISADKARGLQTRLIALDRASDMKKVHGSRVSAADNFRQNKKAIDAIYATLRPDYLLILGAIDVVPHQDLINPAFGGDDVDQYAYGDIPFACEEPYSQQADKFIGPTRVVGRLPDLTSGTDPSYLIGLLETATLWKSLTQQDYSDYFAISAAVWKDSTTLSVQKLFGSSKNLNLSPPRGPKWTDATLARRAHFINCHGGQADPQFYGQKGNQYPIAHQAALVAGKITEGTVAAIECCYAANYMIPIYSCRCRRECVTPTSPEKRMVFCQQHDRLRTGKGEWFGGLALPIFFETCSGGSLHRTRGAGSAPGIRPSRTGSRSFRYKDSRAI
jgi:hypothetical protein